MLTEEERKTLEEKEKTLDVQLQKIGVWMVSNNVQYNLKETTREMFEKSELKFHKDALEKNKVYHELTAELEAVRAKLLEK